MTSWPFGRICAEFEKSFWFGSPLLKCWGYSAGQHPWRFHQNEVYHRSRHIFDHWLHHRLDRHRRDESFWRHRRNHENDLWSRRNNDWSRVRICGDPALPAPQVALKLVPAYLLPNMTGKGIAFMRNAVRPNIRFLLAPLL